MLQNVVISIVFQLSLVQASVIVERLGAFTPRVNHRSEYRDTGTRQQFVEGWAGARGQGQHGQEQRQTAVTRQFVEHFPVGFIGVMGGECEVDGAVALSVCLGVT